jgi:D-3-phosphoglycerate dehydrogenase / 2-oxoglutarate reductase
MSNKLIVTYKMDHLPEFQKKAGYFDTTCQPIDYADLFDIIPDYDYLVPSVRYKLDRKLLLNAGKLKAISTPSTGTDHIDFLTCEELGIKVFSMKNDTEFLSTITATAELAFSHILNVMRMFPSAYLHVLDGKWDASGFCGHELQGKTLGIVGFGRLGSMMGDYGLAFRMSVIACDPYKTIQTDGIRQVNLDELLCKSDIITLHIHLNDETTGLIGRDAFRQMKRGVIIVNTSRGAIIDSNALLDAMEDGTVSGAGLDVIENELEGNTTVNPLVEYARKHDNLIITPHIGGVTIDSQRKAFIHALEKLINFDKGALGQHSEV